MPETVTCPLCKGQKVLSAPYIVPDHWTIYDCPLCRGKGEVDQAIANNYHAAMERIDAARAELVD